VPLFSVLYRLHSYWRIRRITPFLPKNVRPSRLRLAAALQILAYTALVAWWGPSEVLVLLGPGLFLALVVQDLLLLSQHTDMPTNLSRGAEARPFPPQEQGPFTRSLRLPGWLSRLWLHFDAHELHHLYPSVPGYLLRRIAYAPPNEESWWRWVREVKRMSGTRFLFGESALLEGRK
jgi:fatty acid desaturase